MHIHVLLWIVGIDRVEGNGQAHAGKVPPEEVMTSGAVPYSIVRATQFFEFAEMVAGWTRSGDQVRVAPLLLQPVAARDVARALAETAAGVPVGGIRRRRSADPAASWT